jgi:hypothetical protein
MQSNRHTNGAINVRRKANGWGIPEIFKQLIPAFPTEKVAGSGVR